MPSHDLSTMRPTHPGLPPRADTPPSGATSLGRHRDDTPGSVVASRQRARRVDSSDLMAGHTEIEIDHGGAIYRLRLTSLGKLLLTK